MKKSKLTPLARELRKRTTGEERLLWRHLRARRLGGFKFRRQSPLCGYIVDFVCFKKKVVVELDGSQHATADGRAADEIRDRRLQEGGFLVLRFWNHQVRSSMEAVRERIFEVCERR